MKPKTIPLLEQCIEVGVALGLRRAYKHNDNPSDAHVQAEITNAVMGEFFEWFDFPELEKLSENETLS